jgi:hypothetical protein
MGGFKVAVVKGPDKGREVAVAESCEIGREDGVDLVLRDRLVSRRHVRLCRGPGEVTVEDLDSANGTFVNGRRIAAPTTVRPGDQIGLGLSVLELRGAGERAAVAATRQPTTADFRFDRRPRRTNRVSSIAVILLTAALIAAVSAGAVYVATRPSGSLGAGDARAPAATKHYRVVSRAHVLTHVDYAQLPPVGGAHFPIFQNCRVYTRPVVAERAVHSLEHGAVWITYRPGLRRSDVTVLGSLTKGESHVLVSPYPGLPAPVVASAWGRQLVVSSARDARLRAFVRAYRQAPQAPERANPCRGGVDTAG